LSKKNYLFLLFGLIVFFGLIYLFDTEVILESFDLLGIKIFLVFSVAILWIICNTLCLSTLINHQIPFRSLLYNQITGDAYNVITPFAGLGGEPYKANHLTNWISLNEASEAILRDRLIHSLSGILFTSITLAIVIVSVPLDAALLNVFVITLILLATVSILLMLAILSNIPYKFLGHLLKKLKLLKDYRSNPLDKIVFIKALSFKLVGRTIAMLEFLCIFLLLGKTPTFIEIVTIIAMLALSGTLLFIVPQGIGVNEVGISGGFQLIGLPVELGLSFGLIRRARILFWAFLGIGIHYFYHLMKSKSQGSKKL